MRKGISALLILILLMTCMPVIPSAMAEESTVILPTGVTCVAEEAFCGNTGMTTLIVPKGVEEIGSRAFADCDALTEVYLGKNETIAIASDAFEGCNNVHFYAYPDTAGEQWAMMHGYVCDRMEAGSSFFDKAMALVAQNGGATILQSGEFASKRLIVSRSVNYLPDISEFHPNEIVRDNGIYVIQFGSVDETADCYTALMNDDNTRFVEPDKNVEALDEISAAGIVDPGVWDTDDPMGFGAYASFVKENSNGGSVTIAIVDSGVSKLTSYSARLRDDGINMLAAQDGERWSTDYNRHGSVIASVIGDCVGSANVNLLSVRVVGSAGNTDFIAIGGGIQYAVEHGARIINLSLNFDESAYVNYMIDQAVSSGCTVVVAAGNASRSIENVFPANKGNVITVSGLNNRYQLSATSNYGSGVDYCAPDSYIKTTAYTNGLFNGTSFAAPMIASAIALVELDPNHTLSDLNASCLMPSASGSPSGSFGKGMPQLNKLAFIDPILVEFGSGVPSTMTVGQSVPLTWTVQPANATVQTVEVTVSSDVLSVSNGNDGTKTLTAHRQGTTDVTLTVTGTNVSVTRTITVEQPVTSITLSGGKDSLAIGHTMRLTAQISPSDATYTGIEWVSQNENVATIDSDGRVTAVGTGHGAVYARSLDGYGTQSAVFGFEVVEIPDAENLTLTVNGKNVTNGKITMIPGETVTINTAIAPQDADQEVVYKTLGSCISVNNGVLTAVSSGTGYVTVSSKENRDVEATLEVEVVILPTSVSLSAASTTINVSTTTALSASVSPANATNPGIIWSSSNTSVATVSSTGIVTGVASGSAIITATAAGNTAISKSVTITVRQPYTVVFNLNASGDSSAQCSVTSMTAYSGYSIESLPTPTRNYNNFVGWYTEPSGGSQVISASVMTCSTTLTLYAHWTSKPESGWVLESAVPSGAKITQTSYSYRETTESTASSMSGWTQNGSSWKKTGSGSVYYASFPSGYDTNNKYYKEYNKSALTASETATTKREVTNVQDGYIYWHWMYSVTYAAGTTRAISSKKGTFNASGGTSGGYVYQYFYAMASTVNCPALDKYYCCSQNIQGYNCNSIINSFASSTDKTNNKSGLGTDRFFRFNRYRSDYTDYTKYYSYYRDLSYQTTDPGSGNILNKTKYVKYIEQ